MSMCVQAGLQGDLTFGNFWGSYALILAKSSSWLAAAFGWRMWHRTCDDFETMEMLIIVVWLFVAAMLVPMWNVVAFGRGLAFFAAAGPLVGFAWFLGQLGRVAGGDYPALKLAWAADLGVFVSMRLDGLALLFALLVTGIGVLVLIYTGGYMKGERGLARLLSLLLFFMGSMLGVVLSDNLVLMFLFWELTSVSSYLLIGFKHEDATSRRNALQALLVTGFGGLALLGGILLLGMEAGTFEVSELALRSGEVLGSPMLPVILTLILLGAFTKSAQFPFHFWLPNAMAAPTPVSSYLHSATMVKAGVFLLARLNPSLGSAPGWSECLFGFGAVTMLAGGALGLMQTDLKRILAYTTLSVLGMLTMLIGVGTELALQSAVFFLLGHALYKAALFLCAGNVDHACHTRDVTRLRGLRFALPATALAATLAALSKSGFPPFFGFLGKEYAYKSGAALNEYAMPVLVFAFAGNLMLFALAFKAGVHPFYGRREDARLDGLPHGLPVSMWLPPLLLGLVGLAFGILPAVLALPIVQAAVTSLEGEPVKLKVALWHGINLPLLLTVLTIGGGLALYRFRRLVWASSDAIVERMPVRWDRVYDAAYSGVLGLARWQTRIIQNGRLHHYLAALLVSTFGLLGWKLVVYHGMPQALPGTPADPLALAVVVMMGVCAVVAIRASSRFVALTTLGLTGYGIAYLFAHFGAPDLAITQVVVETLTVVFFMTVLHQLPRIRSFGTPGTRVRDAILAGIAGAMVTLLVLISLQLQLAHPISDRLVEWSYAEAHGRNVVNVILVDFRALDTLGEITVLGIAAMGVLVLVSKLHGLRKTEISSKEVRP